MATMGIVDAFEEFGAKLKNPMWAVSSIAADGALVVSCWAHYFRKSERGTLCYFDKLSRWAGNEGGNNLLRNHLTTAFADKLPVRMVVTTAKETDPVDKGQDASKVKKTFHIRKDLVGAVIEFDGDSFVIEFTKT